MTKIALIGAGGKMGFRLAGKLKQSRFDMAYVEVSDAGHDRLRTELGVETSSMTEAVAGANIVILAVPDTAIGKVSQSIESSLKPGTMLVILVAAVPFCGDLPKRDLLTFFVSHPCHRPIF